MANQPIQANSARYIYTLHEGLDAIRGGEIFCKLRNAQDFYLTKETRSDEKVRFTEDYMTSVVRTVLFTHAYDIVPDNSMDDILKTGLVRFGDTGPRKLVNPLHSILECINILDTLLGEHFSRLCSRPVSQIYNSSVFHEWNLSNYFTLVQYPSALDYVRLFRLVNVPYTSHTDCTMFVTRNATDFNIRLQQNCKIL